MAHLGLLAAAAVPLVLLYCYWGLHHRRRKQFGNIPQLKSSLLMGNLLHMNEGLQRGEPDRHSDYLFEEMWNELGRPSCFLVDLWPATWPLLIVANHDIAEQFSKANRQFAYSTPKSPTVNELTPLIGGQSMLIRGGEDWKQYRKRFNPGFATQHLVSLLPSILEKTDIFLEHLERLAGTGEAFKLGTYLTGLTFDIISAVVMDYDFKAQGDEQNQAEILKLFKQLGNSFTTSNSNLPWWAMPKVTYSRWQKSRRTHKLLRELVVQRYEEQRNELTGAKPKTRSILSLSLQGVEKFDSEYIDQTCDQIKTFLFAGHDTTSVMLQWAFYQLSRTPRALKTAIAELDDVLGPNTDPKHVRQQFLERGDDIMRRLTYISAIVKETLRLHPPAATARMPPKGSNTIIRTPEGQDLNVDGLIIYNCQQLIQTNSDVYGPNGHAWVPERWLGNTDTSEATNKDVDQDKKGGAIPASAWRPFERGPRNCIGQELVNIEARIILASTLRRFDFTKVGLGEAELDEKNRPIMTEHGQYKAKRDLYNTMMVTSQPIDLCEMKIRLSDRARNEAL